MGEFVPNPNLAARIFHARQKNQPPDLKDNLIGNNLMNSRNFNFQQPSIDGKRNGIPHGQATDYFVQQKLQSNPYIRGMHPYTSNMMVDIAPSVYNTNPLAGTGGYEHNLASFNGTRPLATALDEPQEIAQRLYEDAFKMSSNNPLSMQFTLNHSEVEKRVRGGMYDAFRLGLDRNNQPEPDYDTVLQSKVDKGYKTGFIPIGDSEKNPIETYLQNQKPLRTSDFNRGIDRVIKHYTPAPIKQMAEQSQTDATDFAAGAPNTLNIKNPKLKNKNRVEIQQDLNGAKFTTTPQQQELITSTHPLMQNADVSQHDIFGTTESKTEDYSFFPNQNLSPIPNHSRNSSSQFIQFETPMLNSISNTPQQSLIAPPLISQRKASNTNLNKTQQNRVSHYVPPSPVYMEMTNHHSFASYSTNHDLSTYDPALVLQRTENLKKQNDIEDYLFKQSHKQHELHNGPVASPFEKYSSNYGGLQPKLMKSPIQPPPPAGPSPLQKEAAAKNKRNNIPYVTRPNLRANPKKIDRFSPY